ncbi:unnamed protein product [Acanthosepion pharaonis]|uniref:Uncharacterized protein n=1 Tax=Acanthosepion pharaonis TaxID=158019 RepID=A0A812B6Z4_ACAPH|nr:unnamed protein product [Sepia pharaonis]
MILAHLTSHPFFSPASFFFFFFFFFLPLSVLSLIYFFLCPLSALSHPFFSLSILSHCFSLFSFCSLFFPMGFSFSFLFSFPASLSLSTLSFIYLYFSSIYSTLCVFLSLTSHCFHHCLFISCFLSVSFCPVSSPHFFYFIFFFFFFFGLPFCFSVWSFRQFSFLLLSFLLSFTIFFILYHFFFHSPHSFPLLFLLNATNNLH